MTLEEFHELTNLEERLRMDCSLNAGRLLRSPTVFEDLVKTICTTNCSWALDEKYGHEIWSKSSARKRRTANALSRPPEAMASVDEKFYRNEIHAGYRSPYFVELAEKVASGKLDPASVADIRICRPPS